MVTFGDAEQEKRIEFLKKREEEELAQVLSRKYGVEYVDLSLVAINTDALRILPEARAKETEAVVFGMVGKKLSLAVRAPENPKVKALAQELSERGYVVTVFMCSQESLQRGWARYADLSYATESKAGVFEISNEEIEKLLAEVKTLGDISKLIQEAVEMKRAYRITRILEVILAGGLSMSASDVHFEPEEIEVHLRYRLDGVLVDVLSLDHETYRLVLSRMKLLSGMKLNITGEAQDGRFSIKVRGDEIELRASVLPGNYGETVVLRILNPQSIAVPLQELGFEPKLLARLQQEVVRPNGMILTTGPTGSGKTTTLYAFLRQVNNPGTKIITIEDPIEYHLPIVQTQVEKNYSFAEGLRSALRADPDIIMVGEIRDNEVAATAINAALTGHLVFSTLHTNNAAGTFPRLIDLGVSEKVLSSAINVAMAQRLVRKLCQNCKVKRAPTEAEQKIIDTTLAEVVDKTLVPQTVHELYDAKPDGCDVCGGRGYKGRVGIFEAIFMDSAIEEMLRTKPSEREIAQAAKPQSIPTMQQDGIIKALRGVTSLDELMRVIDLQAR
ncbi:MAG: type pilus assembly protein PilB [Patescibacteria group bacterium]|nr:type pilus assembly protein PilB [Patescibacteria group bacterium]